MISRQRCGCPCVRTGRVAAVLLLLTGLSIGLPIVDAEELRLDIPIRRVPVPVDEPKRWPAGEWQPLPLEDFEQVLPLMPAGGPRPAPACLERAQYTATLKGGVLAGTVEISARRFTRRMEPVLLDPLNLSLGNLAWPEENALWGTDPRGRIVLVLNREQGIVRGEWSLAGRRIDRSVEFDVKLPPAAASQMIVRLPEARVLRSITGDVRGPRPAEEAGWALWQVDLGSSTQTRLIIGQGASSVPGRPLLLARRDSTYVARPEAVRYQSEFQLDVLEAPVRQISIDVDLDLEVLAVLYGENTNLSWKTEAGEGATRRLVLQLPDAVLGESLVIRLQGLIRTQTAQLWALPQARIVDAVMLEGQLTLRVPPPLELHDAVPDGFRQIGLRATAADGETRTYRQLRRDARLSLALGTVRAEINARVLTHLRTGEDQWNAESWIEWSARAGQVFSPGCRVPADWQITDVSPDANFGGADLTGWDIVTAADGQQTLSLSFLDSLAPDRPKRLRILSRRAAVPLNQAAAIPAFAPTQCDELSNVVIISSDAAARPLVEAKSDFEPISSDDLKADWPSLGTSGTAAAEAEGAIVLRSTQLAPRGEFALQAARDPVDADVRVEANLSHTGLDEIVRVRGVPHAVPLKRVLVFLSESGPPPQWKLVPEAEPAIALEARKLSSAAHAAWNLPAGGDLWEVRFPNPQVSAFTVVGVRGRDVQRVDRISLAFVPHAQVFSGVVEVQFDPAIPAQFQTYRLDPLSGEPRPADASRAETGPAKSVTKRWSYRRSGAELGVRVVLGPHAVVPLVASEALISARVSLESGGADLYRAEYQLLGMAGLDDFRWQMPEGATLVDLQLDGRAVVADREGEEYRLTPAEDTARHRVIMQYHVTPTVGFGPNRRVLAIPTISHPVLSFQLRVQLPENVELAGLPQGIDFAETAPAERWPRRLFGLLTKRDPAPVNTPAARGPDATSSSGWRTLTAQALGAPRQVEFVLWNKVQGRFLAWVGLLFCLGTGVVVRAAKRTKGGLLAAWSTAACLLGVMLLPPLYSGVAGSALVGILLSLLIPRRWLVRRRMSTRTTSSVPPGSTQSFAIVSAGSLGILMLLGALFGRAGAQPPPRVLTGPERGLPPVSVLIPVGSDGKPAGESPLVYVPPELSEKVRELRLRQLRVPDYLIASADYEARIVDEDHVEIRARYRVHVLSTGTGRSVVSVALPLTNVNLGGADACRVNGVAQPVLPGPDGKGVILELPGLSDEPRATTSSKSAKNAAMAGSVSYDVELLLHPAVDVEGVEARARVGIPLICNGRIAVLAERRFASVRLSVPLEVKPAPTAPADPSSDVETRSAWLGRSELLDLRWSLQPAMADVQPELSVNSAVLFTVHPEFVELHCQAQYRVLQGRVESLVWQLPTGAAMRSLQAPDLLSQRVDISDSGERTLLVEFARHQKDEFQILATIVLPLDSSKSPVALPPFDFLADAASRYAVKSKSWQLAFRQPADFRLDLTPPRPEVLKPRPVEEFLQTFDVEGPRPQTAFLCDTFPELTLALNPLKRFLRVEAQTQARCRADRIDITYVAQVVTQTGTSYQYRLQIDPRLRVTGVSVLEDDAECLLRWSRSGDHLLLFLNDKATEQQSVRVSATLRLQLPQDLDLPEIRLLDADAVDSRLALFHDLEVTAEVLSGETLAPSVATDLPADAGVPLGRFDLSQPGMLPHLRLTRNTPEVSVDAVTSIQADEGTWELTAAILFRVLRGHTPNFELLIPRSLTEGLVVQTEPASRQSRRLTREGDTRLLFSLDAPVDERFLVRLSAPVNVAQKVWEVPEISVVGAEVAESLVLLPRSEYGLTPARVGSGLRPASFPTPLRRDFPAFADQRSWECFRQVGRPWRLVPHVARSGGEISRVVLNDTRIAGTTAGRVEGRTSLWLSAAQQDRLELDWPLDIEPAALLVDGQIQPLPRPENGLCAVSLGSRGVHHQVLLVWSAPEAAFSGGISQFQLTRPYPHGVSVSHDLVTIAPPTSYTMSPFARSALPAALDSAIERWESGVELFRSQAQPDPLAESVLGVPLAAVRQLVAVSEENVIALRAAMPAELPEATRSRIAALQLESAEIRPAATRRSARPRVTEGPIDRALFGLTNLGGGPADRAVSEPHESTVLPVVWTVHRGLLDFPYAALLALLTSYAGLKSRRLWQTLQSHETLTWIVLGLFWRLCLNPPWLGWWIILLGIALAVRRRFATDEGVSWGAETE